MDDGSGTTNNQGEINSFTFHLNDFSSEACQIMVDFLGKKFGLQGRVGETHKGIKTYYDIRLAKESAAKLLKLIRPFIHPECAYKFGLDAKACKETVWTEDRIDWSLSDITKVEPSPRSAVVYDLEIEEHHNFFVFTKTSPSKDSDIPQYTTKHSVCVSNCHTLSQWADNFRAAYQHVGDFIRDENPSVVAAFTATAPPEVEADVRRVLGLEKASKCLYYPRRNNLQLTSARYENDFELSQLVKSINGPTIVYCATVENGVEKIGEYLSNALPFGVGIFHGKLPDEAKRNTMDMFMNGQIRCMVATNAFGMGIDKANIRGVIHYDHPGSLEALLQETGRGGRDGLPSLCMTYESERALRTQNFFLEGGHPSRAEMEAVYAVLQRNQGPDGVSHMTGDELAKAARISSMKIGTIKTIFSGNRVIESAKSDEKVGKIRFVGQSDDERFRKYRGIIERIGEEDMEGFWNFDLNGLVHNVGMTWTTVARYLKDWDTMGLVRYVKPFRGNPLKLVGDLRLVPFERLEIKARDARKKLADVLQYFRVPDNQKHQYLEEYVGVKR